MCKKLLYGLLATVMLLATSCIFDEPVEVPVEDTVEVSFSLGLEHGIGTRAISDGANATKLVYAIYKVSSAGAYELLYLDGANQENGQFTKDDFTPLQGWQTPAVSLAKDQAYCAVFWAQNPDAEEVYYTEDLANVKVDYTNNSLNNDETRDAFYATSLFVAAQNKSVAVELKRPFAQLNVGVTGDDFNNSLIAGFAPSKSSVKIGKAPTSINLLTGEVGDNIDLVLAATDIPTDALMVDTDGDESAEEYKWLSMTYILAPAEKTLLDCAEFAFVAEDGSKIKFGEGLNSIPVQRNWRTNIVGNILTGDVKFNIIVNPIYENEYNLPGNEIEIAATEGGVYTLKDDVTLSETLYVTSDMTLNLNGHTLNGSIVVAEGASLVVNKGSIVNVDSSVSGITSNGDLTLNDVEIASARHALRIESGNVVINGGTYEVAPTSAMTVYALNVGDGPNSVANVTVNGGTFVGPAGTVADSGGALTVKDGSTVTINGGDFSGGKTKTLSNSNTGTLVITGGSFDQDPSAWIPEGYSVAYADESYLVFEGNFTVIKDENGQPVEGVGIIENNTYGVLNSKGLKWLGEQLEENNGFEGVTFKLLNDIDLSASNWDPIGDNRTDSAFSGTLDGQNHKIIGAHITGDHCFNGAVYGIKEGWGLFSVTDGATIKNLKIDSATFGSYTVITGTVAGYANNTTFENIEIANTKIAGYNWYTGGVVGWAQGECTFKNVNLDSTVSVGTLWDSHGQNSGGIAGGISSTAQITIEDCNVACVLDVINDVTSNNKWYIYRVSGMLIGNTNTTETKYNEVVTATATNVTCKNVTVTYGKWMNYHYCQGFWNRGWGRYESSDYIGGVDQNEPHNHPDGESHLKTIPFDQLFGGSSNGSGHYPVKGLAEFPGVTVIYPAEYTCEVCGQQHNVSE